MEPTFDNDALRMYKSEFGLQSDLFCKFASHVLGDKLKTSAILQLQGSEMILHVNNIQNEQVGQLINDLALVLKPKIVYKKKKTIVHQTIQPKTISRCMVVDKDTCGQPPLNNSCPIRGDMIQEIKTRVVQDLDFLKKAIKYKLYYIVQDIVNAHPNCITPSVMNMVIETRDEQLFTMCLPRVTSLDDTNVQTAIRCAQDVPSVVHQLLKAGAPVTTGCIQQLEESTLDIKQTILWMKFYANLVNVDYKFLVDTCTNKDILDFCINEETINEVIAKSISINDLDLFTLLMPHYITDANTIDAIRLCIEYNRMDMLHLVFKDEYYSQALQHAIQHNCIDAIKFLIEMDCDVDASIWSQLPDLEILCDEDILPRIFDRLPCKLQLLYNAVCKNDEWTIKYIFDHSETRLHNYHENVFMQTIYNNNPEILELLCKHTNNKHGLSELITLVTDSAIITKSELLAILKFYSQTMLLPVYCSPRDFM